MSIKINAQTVIFKNSPVESVRQDKCEYCHAPFKTIMVTKTIKNTGVKSEIPIEVSGEYFNCCPKCQRRLN